VSHFVITSIYLYITIIYLHHYTTLRDYHNYYYFHYTITILSLYYHYTITILSLYYHYTIITILSQEPEQLSKESLETNRKHFLTNELKQTQHKVESKLCSKPSPQASPSAAVVAKSVSLPLSLSTAEAKTTNSAPIVDGDSNSKPFEIEQTKEQKQQTVVSAVAVTLLPNQGVPPPPPPAAAAVAKTAARATAVTDTSKRVSCSNPTRRRKTYNMTTYNTDIDDCCTSAWPNKTKAQIALDLPLTVLHAVDQTNDGNSSNQGCDCVITSSNLVLKSADIVVRSHLFFGPCAIFFFSS